MLAHVGQDARHAKHEPNIKVETFLPPRVSALRHDMAILDRKVLERRCFQTRVCFDAASGCELTDVLQAGRGRCRLRSNHESHIQRDHVSTRTTRRTASGLRKR